MFIKTTLTIAALALLGCGTAEKQSTSPSGTTDTVAETAKIATVDTQKLKAEGYVPGTIVYSDKEGDCLYTIQMSGDKNHYLDPVNLEEKFKKNGQKVWIKFNGLRRMNRCHKAAPVEITAIKKGE